MRQAPHLPTNILNLCDASSQNASYAYVDAAKSELLVLLATQGQAHQWLLQSNKVCSGLCSL